MCKPYLSYAARGAGKKDESAEGTRTIKTAIKSKYPKTTSRGMPRARGATRRKLADTDEGRREDEEGEDDEECDGGQGV